MGYKPRIIDKELTKRLSSSGAVVIEGPKASGKTTTARQFAASEVLLDIDENARQTVKVEPELILSGDVPRLIDEWQLEPKLWNYIRRTIDERNKKGQFILTGSAVLSDDITRHTGAGRITRLYMRPMTLFEKDRSTGDISIKKLLDGEIQKCKNPDLSIQDIAELISMGGWPIHIDLNVEQVLQGVRDYLDEIKRTDISRVDKTNRNPQRVESLLKSIARNISTDATITTLTNDTRGPDGPLGLITVRDYLDALTRIMIYEEQPAWAPHLRSKSRLRKASKHHFVDPSLAVAALRASPGQLLNDINYLGLLFESMVIRDLRVFAQNIDGKVFHYRDNTGLEVDAIIETPSGKWGAFEIKLGTGRIEEAAKNLLKFNKKIDTKKCGNPAVMGVITAKGYGHVRKDGIAVIPIGALGP